MPRLNEVMTLELPPATRFGYEWRTLTAPHTVFGVNQYQRAGVLGPAVAAGNWAHQLQNFQVLILKGADKDGKDFYADARSLRGSRVRLNITNVADASQKVTVTFEVGEVFRRNEWEWWALIDWATGARGWAAAPFGTPGVVRWGAQRLLVSSPDDIYIVPNARSVLLAPGVNYVNLNPESDVKVVDTWGKVTTAVSRFIPDYSLWNNARITVGLATDEAVAIEVPLFCSLVRDIDAVAFLTVTPQSIVGLPDVVLDCRYDERLISGITIVYRLERYRILKSATLDRESMRLTLGKSRGTD